MKHISLKDIKEMERIPRLNLINGLTGFKSANLIGTISEEGDHNLAIFSSVVHLGSSPPLLGCITRPATVERHTYENIKKTGVYTINSVHQDIIERAHYTSANFDRGDSEFIACGLTPEFNEGSTAPFVKESRLKMAMKLVDEIKIEANGTILLIGEIQDVYMVDGLQQDDGTVDLAAASTVAISGLDQYHAVPQGEKFPYARQSEMPDLKKRKQRSDAVAYDEETETYNAALLPYASSVSGPAFKADDLTLWKNETAGKVSAHFKTRFEEIKSEYQAMVDQYSWNEIVYTAKFSFEPVVGETYHLYERDNSERYLSMIPPESWKKTCLGSFQLTTDKMWVKLDTAPQED